MKTKEFIRKVEEMGYHTRNLIGRVSVEYSQENTPSAIVSKCTPSVVFLNTGFYPLIKLCIEYAETPIKDREEEKKYRVRIPDSPERTPVYALCKLANGCVVIKQTNESNFQEHDRYRLTESEIKRNHEYLWQFAKEIEMEGKDNE